MIRKLLLAGTGALALAMGPPDVKTTPSTTGELEAPVRLMAGGKYIDTAVGHAAPHVCDYFGDGKNHLLVGQFGEGLLWIYRNNGTNAKPELAAGIKFKDGAKGGRVPTG